MIAPKDARMIGVSASREFSRPTDRVAWQRRLVAAPLALLSVVLLVIAVPRTVGVILSARSEPVLRKLQDQQPVYMDELKTLADVQERGQFWLDDGRLRTDLGLAYLLIAGNCRAPTAMPAYTCSERSMP